MKKMPEFIPEYKIEASTETPFFVKWEELMGWFLIPKLGEKLSWGMYDIPSRKCSHIFDMQVTGKAKVHGIEGVELTAREASYSDKNEVVILKNKYFGDFCRRFYAESEADPTLASFIIINMIEELFLNVLRTLKTNYDKSNASSILSYKTSAITSEIVLAKNIEDYMNMPGCTLTVLADKLNMCPRNTQKIIKRIYGQSFSQRQADIRLKRAIYLIEKTDLSFTEIAKAVNYNQYASFRKAFINKFGISPSEYKAKLT